MFVCFYYVYERIRPLVNTTLFRIKLKFCPLNHKGRRINSWNYKKYFSVNSEVLGGGEPLICVIFSVYFSFNATPCFQSKKLFHVYFFIVFLNNDRKCCAPFMEIFVSNFSMESFPHLTPPLLKPSSQPKIPLETSVHFPITITMCKHWPKFETCSPSHGDCGGVSRPQRHSYMVFRL